MNNFIRNSIVSIVVIITFIPMVIYVSAVAIFYSMVKVAAEWPPVVYDYIYNRNINNE